MWSRAGPKEKTKLVVEQVRRQEEMLRGTKAVAQAKQGQWLNWESLFHRADYSLGGISGRSI